MMPILLICVAFAVDVSRWYLELQRLQRAADAGALAAAPWMPDDLVSPSSALDAALAAVERNGYPVDADTTVSQGGTPSQVRVQVKTRVNNIFASVVGWGNIDLARAGVADFTGPIAMGSPCNLFGREDMESPANRKGSADCANTEEYWVNIAGQYTNKARGDGFSSSWCTKPDGGQSGIDECANLPPLSTNWGTWQNGNPVPGDLNPQPGTNTDYADHPGYVFKVRVKASGSLQLEGYDIGWVATGDACNEGNLYDTTAPIDPRFAKANNEFCTGDTQMTGAEGITNATSRVVETTVTVRGPSVNPYKPLEGAVLCTMTLPGYDKSTSAGALGDAANYPVLNRVYHQWSNLLIGSGPGCGGTIAASPGDYSIQVQTTGGGGQNRFALRAALQGGDNKNVSIFAVDRVSLFNNVPVGTSRFNLVRLDSTARDHILEVKFFDLGDANDGVTATLLKPTRNGPSDVTTNLTNCTSEGPVDDPLPTCSLKATPSTHGGRWQTIKVPIDFDPCPDRSASPLDTADKDQSRCWIRVELDTDDKQADTTTWTAKLLGDPVRLVQ